MASISSTSAYSAYQGYSSAYATTALARAVSTSSATTSASSDTAATVTLSDSARAALSERSFAAVLVDAHDKLTTLLEEADRKSPIENDQLALDLAGLDDRELYAMSSDDSFSDDERTAAGLEMQRRFESALSGPAAIARVTGSYLGLYKAAATYLDKLGPEERASADWQAGRDAVDAGLDQLKSAPGTLPDAGDSDPVALYLALSQSGDSTKTSTTGLAANARATLDQLYAQAKANGRMPTFNARTTTGTYIDLSSFSSRTLSAIVLDDQQRFSSEEINAARAVLQKKSGATLLSGFQSAAKSSDPTAFSQNIIAAFSSLSADERQAVGWSDELYQAAMQSYASTSKLMQMFGQATGTGSGSGGLATLLGG